MPPPATIIPGELRSLLRTVLKEWKSEPPTRSGRKGHNSNYRHYSVLTENGPYVEIGERAKYCDVFDKFLRFAYTHDLILFFLSPSAWRPR